MDVSYADIILSNESCQKIYLERKIGLGYQLCFLNCLSHLLILCLV
jgi:hypothetical protein